MHNYRFSGAWIAHFATVIFQAIHLRRWAAGVLVLWLFLAALADARAAGAVLGVSPEQGARGILKALEQVRELRRSATPPTGPVRVLLGPGDYVLEQPLMLGSEDSGTAESPLIVEAAQRNTVRLIGAKRLVLRDSSATVWSFRPDQKTNRDDERSAGQFYVNGRRAVLAREPKAGGYWLVARPDKRILYAQAADADALAKVVGADAGRAVVGLMQSWTSGRHRIGSINAATAGIRLTPEPRWSYLEFGPQQRYFVENVPGAWTAPGEWIGANGSLMYRPLPADTEGAATARDAAAYWPRLPRLLVIQGQPANPVQHVHFINIDFAYSGLPTPPGGWTDNQAAAELPAAIELTHTAGIQMRECSIRHTGAYAIWLKQSVRGTRISGCILEDLGAGGIKVGMEQTAGGADKTGDNVIRDNVIVRTGREFFGAVGIWVGRTFDNVVDANVVAQTSYTGISVGWSWGYDEPSSGSNRIANNVLLDIGQAMLSDMGAIYTLGRSPGTVVSGNFVRRVEDFTGYGAGAWGLYNDEGSEGIVVENNVVIAARSGGYQLHYGRDLDVRNNLFAQGRVAEIRWANVSRSGNWRFQNNGIDTAPGRPSFEFHNDNGITAARTLGELKAGEGSQPVRVSTGIKSADVRIEGADAGRLKQWRSVILNAEALIDRAKGLGVKDLEMAHPGSR